VADDCQPREVEVERSVATQFPLGRARRIKEAHYANSTMARMRSASGVALKSREPR
jgi:hypothetical protein